MASRFSFVSLAAVLVAAVLGAAGAAGCSGSSKGPAEALTATGPYAVGKVTLELRDTSRVTRATANSEEIGHRTLVTDVYYPAAGGSRGEVSEGAAPAADEGSFPLVVVAHGLFGQRTNFAGTNALLASQGYVVAALDFPLTNFSTFASETVYLPDLFEQPGDLSFVIDALTGVAGANLAGGGAVDSALVRIVNPEQIGIFGHSYGGATVLLTGYSGELVDPRVDALIALSPFSCFFGSETFPGDSAPLLLIHGSSDAILEAVWSEELHEFLQPPEIYVAMQGGDHMGFTSDPTRPEGERDLEFFDVVSSSQEAAESTLADFGLAAIQSVPGVDLGRCALRPLIAEPGTELDPAIPLDRQRMLNDAAMILFLDAHVRGNAETAAGLADKIAELGAEMQVAEKN